MYIRIPDDLHAGVKRKALADGISMNHIAVTAIKNYLESITIKAAIEQHKEGEVMLTIDGPDLEMMSEFLDKYKETRDQWGIKTQRGG